MPAWCVVLVLVVVAYWAGRCAAVGWDAMPHLAAARHWLALHVLHRREIQDFTSFLEVAATGQATQGPGTLAGRQSWWHSRHGGLAGDSMSWYEHPLPRIFSEAPVWHR